MKRALCKIAFVAFGLALLGEARPASADFAGTLVVNDMGITSGTLGGNSFTFQVLSTGVGTTAGTSGVDVPGEPFQLIGTATLTLGGSPSLVFGNDTVGTFTGDSTSVTSSSPTSETIYVHGTFVTGTALGAGQSYEASFQVTISLNNGQLGSHGVLSVPPANLVPEPASLAMVALGLGGLAAGRRGRRKPG
jgi:hypothetical protein